ncbi:hypothetical protein AVEN_77039-1 [Araneus ventricosus]|uniref:Receptor ligand binding region domain-containing protein n=1 Tax=Araneus ventricosus TaxID=182803 RepID=A0A4Y2G1K2_ARAVE|nr:hypothetical protein AVEN_77039-1 [Araneus ventricosus]
MTISHTKFCGVLECESISFLRSQWEEHSPTLKRQNVFFVVLNNSVDIHKINSNLNKYLQHITEFAAYLYDSVILYAEALAQTLAEGEDPRNGTFIIQKIINKGMYQSVTGAWMHVDENGDVEGNYTVLALQNAPQNITLKGLGGEKNLSHLMLPMARFQYDGETGEPVRSRGMFTLLSESMFVNYEDFYHFIFLKKTGHLRSFHVAQIRSHRPKTGRQCESPMRIGVVQSKF